MSTVGQGSAAEETQPPETKLEVLQTKITQLEGEAEFLSKLKQENRLVRQAQETLDFKCRDIIFETWNGLLNSWVPLFPVEKKIRKTMEEGMAQTWNYFAMFRKLHYDHEKEVLRDREQLSTILQGRIKYYAERSKKH